MLYFKFQLVLSLLILFSTNFSSAQENKIPILDQPLEIKTVTSTQKDNGQMQFKLRLLIPEKHFVYADSLAVESYHNNLNNGSFSLNVSPVVEFRDKFSNNELKKGLKENGEIVFTVPYNFDYESKFFLMYRACTDEFCYLPKKLSFEHGIKPVSSNTSLKLSNTFSNFSINFNQSSTLLILLFVFLAGILTSFTPCIFPLLPITLALISQDIVNSRFKAFKKTVVYVLGIATTYSILGLIAASTGSFFGQFLASPLVLICIGLFYFVLASSMIGLWELNFLSNFQNRVKQNRTQTWVGVFIYGVFTGLFASPCVGPVLIGILTYAAQSKDMAFSFIMLFIYALGLGQIFIAISLSGSLLNKLPRSGSWMTGVKVALALLLVAAGLFFFIPGVQSLLAKPEAQHVQYSETLEKALQSSKPVVVDFSAKWCAACLEMDKTTFVNDKVKEALKNFEFIKVDVTENNSEKSALLKKYKVLGLPTILFFDKNGTWLEKQTVTKYVSAKEMLELLQKAQTPNESENIK